MFDAQEPAYRDSVLPPAVTRRLAIEAGVSDGWWKYVGSHGKVIGLDRFGESAPAGVLFKTFGFTVDNVVGQAEPCSNLTRDHPMALISCANCWTTPPSTATACRRSTSTTWSRSRPSWRRLRPWMPR
ncbi:transketolase-like TK C-terminal-containing protein [Methylococcus capsulatus]|uniref:transketolase-like TK C-terminal-containing protein n=1 Tax=Methylococcus capsulatus TaxID=414 RepID=UPI00211AD26F|nr:hypothetical protein [Methylococcus capsulatus]